MWMRVEFRQFNQRALFSDRVRRHKVCEAFDGAVVSLEYVQLQWLAKRHLVVAPEAGFVFISLLWRLRQHRNPICMVTRFRLEAAVHEPAAPSRPR